MTIPSTRTTHTRWVCLILVLVVIATSRSSFAFTPTPRTHPHQTTTTSRSSSSSSSSTSAFLDNCRILCQQRNLPLEKVKNARDLATVVTTTTTPTTSTTTTIQPGRVFRMGRVSDATEADIQLLFRTLNITTLVDTRSPTELKDDPTLMRPQVFANFTNLVYYERTNRVRELKPGQSPVKKRSRPWKRRSTTTTNTDAEDPTNADTATPETERTDTTDTTTTITTTTTTDDMLLNCIDDTEEVSIPFDNVEDDDDSIPTDQIVSPSHSQQRRPERHFVSLMNEFKYVKGTVSKLRKRDLAKAALKSPGALVSKKVRQSVQKPFLDEINDGGLPMLNELLLRMGAPGIRYVLELCADRRHHPIAFYCTAGKDRTGVIAAIVLKLCGVESEDIVQDYALSANVYAEMNDHRAMVGALSQRNLDPKTFLGAPPQVMRDTLEALEENYGSVEDYCDWIGFGRDKQAKLIEAMTK